MTAIPEVLPPPYERFSILGWLRKNLFSNWLSTLITFISLYVIFVAVRGVVLWAFNTARWEVIAANIQLLMVGQYPSSQLWRIWVIVGLLGVLVGLAWGIWIRERSTAALAILSGPFLMALLPGESQTRILWASIGVATLIAYLIGRALPQRAGLGKAMAGAWLLYLPLVFLLVRGWTGEAGLIPYVPTNVWGGLLLTTLIAAVGVVASFPIGILLALGRLSRYPLMRAFSVVYIELVRSVPLISVFFMAQTMLPLFLPQNIEIDRVVRAMVAFTLFAAAYMAENVRGGLQAIPKGQHEAAAAVGLNSFQSLRLVILPQALKNILPILTASVIGSFRDTSLVMIVGLLDLLGIARVILAQPAFLGRHIEVYTFLAAVYWIISYLLSYLGQVIEARVGVRN